LQGGRAIQIVILTEVKNPISHRIMEAGLEKQRLFGGDVNRSFACARDDIHVFIRLKQKEASSGFFLYLQKRGRPTSSIYLWEGGSSWL